MSTISSCSSCSESSGSSPPRGRRRGARTPLPLSGAASPATLLRARRAREERYAASKWGDAPSATALPPPPTHWRRDGRCWPEPDRALSLKMLLNVGVMA